MNRTAPKLVTTTYRQHGLPVVTGYANAEISAAPLCRRFRPSPCPAHYGGRLATTPSADFCPVTPGVTAGRAARNSGRVRWCFHGFRRGPQSGSHSPFRPQARQISPNKDMNYQCTTAAFTLSPVPDGLRHLVLTRPGTRPSMRFLSVGSHVCARASFRHPLAGLPLPSASSYYCIIMKQLRDSYRGLSPHQFMPMPGVHNTFQPTALPPLRSGKPPPER